MKRTQVFLPEQIIEKLDTLALEKGISKGEIIRRALEEYLKEGTTMKVIAKAGEWRIRDGNGKAESLTEKFSPDLYDLDQSYRDNIEKLIKDDDLYIEIKEDDYWIAL